MKSRELEVQGEIPSLDFKRFSWNIVIICKYNSLWIPMNSMSVYVFFLGFALTIN